MKQAHLETRIPGLSPHHAGKVRDLYRSDGRLVIVATDRISAYDVVLPNGIPGRGVILTQLTRFWLDLLDDVCPNHLVTCEVDEMPEAFRRDELRGRTMLVDEVEIVPFECVVRGYLAGSGWREYRESGEVCGIRLPDGLQEADRLPEPIFTPATKETEGHDINVSEAYMAGAVGEDLTSKLRDLSVAIYSRAAEHAWERGLILADTKFEFGLRGGGPVLADEVLSPDSSRFWLREDWQPGRSQQMFDKQYLRDWLDTQDWDKTPPGPELPPQVVEGVLERYLEAYRRLTGAEIKL
jgi:phosphoribosylaminoimidazole-succinocarboxamide synthase